MFHAAISPSTRREYEQKKDFTIVRSHCANNNAQLTAQDNLRLPEHETTVFSQVRSTENTYTKLKWPFLFFLRAPLSHNHSYRTSSSFDLTRHDYSGSKGGTPLTGIGCFSPTSLNYQSGGSHSKMETKGWNIGIGWRPLWFNYPWRDGNPLSSTTPKSNRKLFWVGLRQTIQDRQLQ